MCFKLSECGGVWGPRVADGGSEELFLLYGVIFGNGFFGAFFFFYVTVLSEALVRGVHFRRKDKQVLLSWRT
jgi:hypothetical protein